MKVVVVGALGKVAQQLVPLLEDRGDDVVGIVRSPEQIDRVADLGADPALLDVEHASAAEIATVLAGADAVVWSAGAGGGNPARTYAVDRDAAIRSMDAASAAGVRRYVMVSWIGSTPDHGVPQGSGFFPYAEAKLAADDHLRGTDLDWTILGPGTLTDDPPTGTVAVLGEVEPRPRDARVSRADVALVVAAALADPASVGRFLRFTAGNVPAAEAVRA